MELIDLKQKEGEIIEYFYRGKFRKYKLIAVQLDDQYINKDGNNYKGNIGDFRLNHIDGEVREWDGFWTNKIDRIKV